MKKVGLGIIGLGYIGNIHLQNSLKISGAYVAGVADVSKKRLSFAKQLGVKKTFIDYVDLLKDPDIDSVIIGLPNHLHLKCVQIAAESLKNILLEKPIARTPEEGKQIISAVQKNSVKLMMGYPMRFNSTFQNLRDQIERGYLGDVEVAHAVNIGSGPFFERSEKHAPAPVPEWWFNKKLTGGGVLIDLGIHMINLLRWYFGEVTDIRSRLKRRFNLEFEDSCTCLATFSSGTIATINVGWFSQQHRISVDLFGSVKHATTFTTPTSPILNAMKNLTTGTPKGLLPFLLELQHFINFTVKDISPISSAEDGLKDIEAISLAYKNQF